MDFIELGNSYLGFTDNKKESQKTRVEKMLDKKETGFGNNQKATCKEFILAYILLDFVPVKLENLQWYKKNGELTKPKTEYRLRCLDGSLYFEISKTEYDFAVYVRENFYTSAYELSAKKIQDFITAENQRKQAEAEREAEQARKLAEANRIARENEVRIDSLVKADKENITKEEINLIRSVFEKKYRNFSEEDLNRVVYSNPVPTYVRNFDDPTAKEKLIGILYNENRASIKIFEIMTGLKLPTAYKKRTEYLRSITSADFKR